LSVPTRLYVPLFLDSSDKADIQNLGSKVFFIWGSTCVLCMVYAYFLIWETKGLTLEQVDRMMEETQSPRHSSSWKPHSTFASEMGMAQDKALQHHGEKAGNGHVDGTEDVKV
jgi:hypothetical protein